MNERTDVPGIDAAGIARLSAKGFADPVFHDVRFLALVDLLSSLDRVVVAYSGGVDSAFLLRVARTVLGDGAIGALGISESLDRGEQEEARRTAAAMAAPIVLLQTREYDNPLYRANAGDRCYHCKTELFREVRRFAEREGISHVLDGSNADDVGDYRPGFRARDEQGVRSPLLEVGLDKESVRRFSRALGLETWDKPAAPCLSSRIPHGEEVTDEKLRQVESAEGAIRALGFRVARVRHHGRLARIEVPAADLPRLLASPVREEAAAAVKRAGFVFVSVDLEGFRSGSLNEALAGHEAPGAPAPLIPVESVGRLRPDPS